MMSQIFASYKFQIDSPYSIRTQNHQGREHLVVPVIMMVEGVHHGSAGPMLHPASELSRHPAAWNGIPVVIYHPELEGQPIQANVPEVIESEEIGRIYNTYWEDGRLKAEAWIDTQKISRVSPAVLDMLRQGARIDVSIGAFTDDEVAVGSWNNERYSGISRNHRPDHLALLPGARGACSWEDGCGVRVNGEGKGGGDLDKSEHIAQLMESIEAYSGIRRLMEAIQQKLDLMDNDQATHYLEEVFPETKQVVYRIAGPAVEGRESPYYQMSYSVDEAGDFKAFDSPAVPVRKNVTFTEVQENAKKGEQDDMGNEKEAQPCCAEKVQMLIESGAFSESDRDALSTLGESQIEKLITMAGGNEEPSNTDMTRTKPPVQASEPISKEQAISVLREAFSTPEGFLSILPETVRAQMTHGMSLYSRQRAAMESFVQENCGGVYSEQELKAMDFPALEKIHQLMASKSSEVPKNPTERLDYSGLGQSPVPQANVRKVQPLLPTGVNESA